MTRENFPRHDHFSACTTHDRDVYLCYIWMIVSAFCIAIWSFDPAWSEHPMALTKYQLSPILK